MKQDIFQTQASFPFSISKLATANSPIITYKSMKMNKGTASDRKLLFASVASIRKTKLAKKALNL